MSAYDSVTVNRPPGLAEALSRAGGGVAADTAEVLVIGLPGAEQVLRFTSGCYTIGRGDQCDLVLDSRYTSRTHARIVRTDARFFFLEDRSRNGTYMREGNGRLVHIKPGQRIPLLGQGTIGLGWPPTSGSSSTVHYRLMRMPRD
jgi:pSer/pThr/pTyr-binding forkhead associated (FHA) protein